MNKFFAYYESTPRFINTCCCHFSVLEEYAMIPQHWLLSQVKFVLRAIQIQKMN